MKTFVTIVAIAALAAPMALAAGAADEYHAFMLAVDSPPDGTFAGPQWKLSGGFAKGAAQLENTSDTGGRDAFLNVREGTLTLAGNALKGQFKTYDAKYRIGTWTLEGAVDGNQAAGAYTVKFLTPKTGEETSHSGKFTGTITPGSELAKSNAIAAGKDWPCWSGPYTNMAATPTGHKLVDDLDQARLVWRSQQTFQRSQGNWGHPYRNYDTLFFWPLCSGGSSPIVADGKVFATQWFPDGKEYHAEGLKKLQDAAARWGLKEPLPAVKLHVSQTCHDWYICLDAATGQTLWVAEFPEETGMYFENERAAPDHKNGPTGLTPCYANGKLFGLGMSGYLRAMDAKTGKLLWKQKIADTKPVNRGNCNHAMFIGGVVMTGNHAGTLYAFDPETGKELWKGACNSVSDPQRWVHAGTEYAIVHAAAYPKAEYRCQEPKTGKVLWSLSDHLFARVLGIRGDTIAVLKGKDAKTQELSIAAYRLTPEKAEMIWEVPATGQIAGHASIVVLEKYVAAFGDRLRSPKGWLLDLATGKEAAVTKADGPSNHGHVQVAEDRLFIRPDGVHGSHIGISMLGATPETFKVMGNGEWSPKIPFTSSYASKHQTMPIVDGRMYIRGADGIYCYDLRKTPGMFKVESVLQDAKASDGAVR